MIREEYKHSELTGNIIKCAFTVYNALGCGFPEVIYQRALAIELDIAGIQFVREQEMPLYYREHHIGERRVDFLVENEVLIELKALPTIENGHMAQAINYLEAFKLEVGLIINFGAPKLEFGRLMKNEQQLKKGNHISFDDYKKQ